jgi:hypothetical protein
VRLLLSFDTTQNDLQDAFAAHGTVVELTRSPIGSRVAPAGSALVTMSNDDEAEAAIGAMNGSELERARLESQ